MEDEYSPWATEGDLPPVTTFKRRSSSIKFELNPSLPSLSPNIGPGGSADYGFGGPSWSFEPDQSQGGWSPAAADEYEPAASFEPAKSSLSGVEHDDLDANALTEPQWSPTLLQSSHETPQFDIPEPSARPDDDQRDDDEQGRTEERDWGGFGQSPPLSPIKDVDTLPDEPTAKDSSLPTEGWTAEWEPEEPPPPLPSFGDVFEKAKTPVPAVGLDEPSPSLLEKPAWSPVIAGPAADEKPSWQPETLDIESVDATKTVKSARDGDSWSDLPSQGLVKGKSIPAALIDELKVKTRVYASETWRVPDGLWGEGGFQQQLSAALLDTLTELPSTSSVTLETPLSALFKQSNVVRPAYRDGIVKTAAKTTETLKGQSRPYRPGARYGLGNSITEAQRRTGTPPPHSATAPKSIEGGSPRRSNEESPQQQSAIGRLFGRFRKPAPGPSAPGPTAASVLGVPYDSPDDSSTSPTRQDSFAAYEPSTSADQNIFSSAPSEPAGQQQQQQRPQAGSEFDFLAGGDNDFARPIVRQELPRNTNSLDPFDPLVSDRTPFSTSSATKAKLEPVSSFHPVSAPSTSAAPASTVEQPKDEFDDFFNSFSSPPRKTTTSTTNAPPMTNRYDDFDEFAVNAAATAATSKALPARPKPKPALQPVRTTTAARHTPMPRMISPNTTGDRSRTPTGDAQQQDPNVVVVIRRLSPPPPSSSSATARTLSPTTSLFAPPPSSTHPVGSGSGPSSRSASPLPPPPLAPPRSPLEALSMPVVQPQQPRQGNKSYDPSKKAGALTLDDLSFFES